MARVHSTANASPSRGFVFGPRGGPFVPFSVSPHEGNGAPAGAFGSLRYGLPLGRPCDRPAFAPSFRDPSRLRAVGVPGRAGPLRRALRLLALHRGPRCRRPHLAPSSGVAVDDALSRARRSGYTPRWANRKVEHPCLQAPSTLCGKCRRHVPQAASSGVDAEGHHRDNYFAVIQVLSFFCLVS
jgi:hypothetical protein